MNVIENIEMTEALKKAGYAIIRETACTLTVADPYCGYKSGKYAVDGHNEVTLRSSANVRKFISDRE